MKRLFLTAFYLVPLLCAFCADKPNERYSPGRPSFDGIGKYYMGREISKVMGHLGAGWLERDTRQAEERTDLLVKALKLKEGDKVADIGAGSGYFTRRISPIVGESGKVYAVDIQQEMLDILGEKMKEAGVKNHIPILGTITDPKLPKGEIDLAFMVDVYHEFSHPYEMIDGIVKSLKKGGRLVWVEYRKEDPAVRIKPLHKMSEEQVKKEASEFPLEHAETISVLPLQHIIIFKKK